MNNPELEAMLQQICNVLNVPIEDVKGTSKRREPSDTRKIFIYNAVHVRHAMGSHATTVILKSRSLVNPMIKSYLDLLFSDPEFRAKASLVEKELKAQNQVAV